MIKDPRETAICILAIGTSFLSGLALWIGWEFFDWAYDRSIFNVDAIGLILITVIVLLVAFAAGYCRSALKGPLTRWFWIASAVFNLILSGALIFIFLTIGFGISTNDLIENLAIVLPLWTIFAAAYSVYLCRYPGKETGN